MATYIVVPAGEKFEVRQVRSDGSSGTLIYVFRTRDEAEAFAANRRVLEDIAESRNPTWEKFDR